MTTFTVPDAFRTLISPAAERATVTWFAIADWPADQVMLDETGCVASAGQMVRFDVAVGFVIVTVDTMEFAEVGILQLP